MAKVPTDADLEKLREKAVGLREEIAAENIAREALERELTRAQEGDMLLAETVRLEAELAMAKTITAQTEAAAAPSEPVEADAPVEPAPAVAAATPGKEK